jgi:hypothetical protein
MAKRVCWQGARCDDGGLVRCVRAADDGFQRESRPGASDTGAASSPAARLVPGW